jgi:hypothetical protein
VAGVFELLGDYLREGTLVLICVAAIGIASAVVPSHANQSFYSAAAQIIPVLLLALAFQLQAFRVRGRSSGGLLT